MKTQRVLPDLVQSFDCFEDRIYKKIVPGFIFNNFMTVRTDRMRLWNEWEIICEKLPDNIIVNGKEFELKIKN